MRIEQSTVSLSSSHELTRSLEKQESLQIWKDRNTRATGGDEVVLSLKGKTFTLSMSGSEGEDTEVTLDKRYLVLARLISRLTGKEVTVYCGTGRTGKTDGTESTGQPDGSRASGSEGWGLIYDSTKTYTEKEQTAFAAEGVVTAGGKEYSFSTSLIMERLYSTSSSVSVRAGDALKDPLVINLGQGFAEFSGEKIEFDIDMDGEEEDVPTLDGNSGYLAIDKNGNGIIDDGSELFGPATGDAFEELAAYDEDGNGWIDEGDSVYSRLSVWVQTGEAEGLKSLDDLDVGAIYTGSISTPFQIKDSDNVTEAMIRQTSIYLTEDGSVGTTQKLDIAV